MESSRLGYAAVAGTSQNGNEPSTWGLDYGLDDQVKIPGGGNYGNFSLRHRVRTGSGTHPASYPTRTGRSFPEGQSGRDVTLTAQLHLVPRLKMCGAITPLPQYVFIAWCVIKQWVSVHGVVLVKHRDNFTPLTLPEPIPPI
jgi:hypothetical protein